MKSTQLRSVVLPLRQLVRIFASSPPHLLLIALCPLEADLSYPRGGHADFAAAMAPGGPLAHLAPGGPVMPQLAAMQVQLAEMQAQLAALAPLPAQLASLGARVANSSLRYRNRVAGDFRPQLLSSSPTSEGGASPLVISFFHHFYLLVPRLLVTGSLQR